MDLLTTQNKGGNKRSYRTVERYAKERRKKTCTETLLTPENRYPFTLKEKKNKTIQTKPNGTVKRTRVRRFIQEKKQAIYMPTIPC